MNVRVDLQHALRLEQQGETSAALSSYDRILARFPGNRHAQQASARLKAQLRNPPVDALQSLAALEQRQDWTAIAHRCHQLVGDFPDSDKLWRHLGQSAQHLHRHDVAKQAFLRAVGIQKTAGSCARLAHAYETSGDFVAAARWYEEAAQVNPRNRDYRKAQGIAALKATDFEAAARAFQSYLRKNKAEASAWSLLGEAALHLGETDKAVEAYQRAAKLGPRNDAHFANLGVALRNAGQLGAATEASRKAIELNPKNTNARVNLGNQLYVMGQVQPAIEAYEDALAIDETRHAAQAQKLHLQAKLCDWSAFDEFNRVAPDLGIRGEAVVPWAALKFEDDPGRQHLRSKRYAANWRLRERARNTQRKGRIRLGYVTSDLYDHATMYLLAGVLEQHDPTRFEVFLYGLNPPRESAVADRAKEGVHVFRDLHRMSDDEIVRIVRQDTLDIAVDLKGYTKDARTSLFFRSLAPIQINYLGYPGTMGSACMDYLIADPVVVPQAQRQHYSEKIIYLPNSYQPNDNRRQIAQINDTRADHGLPEAAFVMCCFNNSYKLAPPEFDIWMRIMAQQDDAVLWLIDPGEVGVQNLRQAAQARGVAPDRLVFADHLPQAEHLARYTHADLFVDTFNYTAHTTASDALWAGVPVITYAGQQFAARVGASLLSAMGRPELIADTVEEYEALIRRYATDRAALAALRAQIAERPSLRPLFDTETYTRHLEAGYSLAMKAHQAQTATEDIYVSAS